MYLQNYEVSVIPAVQKEAVLCSKKGINKLLRYFGDQILEIHTVLLYQTFVLLCFPSISAVQSALVAWRRTSPMGNVGTWAWPGCSMAAWGDARHEFLLALGPLLLGTREIW